jgi:hypothetical protein
MSTQYEKIKKTEALIPGAIMEEEIISGQIEG